MCTILKKLGEGASAKVFLLQVNRNKKKYALKIINTGSQDEADAAMSEKEAALLLRLNHQQVIKCVDAFQKGPHLLLITEYCSLGDLAQHIAARQAAQPHCLLDQTQVLQWADNLAQALAYLHQQKVLHRDLKPSNIFIAEDSSLKIGDLGIAKELERTVAKASTFIGTLLYMSPEIFSWQQYGYEADVWSLGCCLFEMMALAYPFWAELKRDIFRKIRNADYGELPERYSAELRQLVESMLQTDPALRPTASHVATQLQSLRVTPEVKVRARKRRYLKLKAAEAAARQAEEDPGVGEAGAVSRYDIFQAVVLYYKQGWEDSELSVDELEMLTNISSSSGSSDSRTVTSRQAEKCAEDAGAGGDEVSNTLSSKQQAQPASAISESADDGEPEARGDTRGSQMDLSQTLLASAEQPTLVSSSECSALIASLEQASLDTSTTHSTLPASAEQLTLTSSDDASHPIASKDSVPTHPEDVISGLRNNFIPADNSNNNAPIFSRAYCPDSASTPLASDFSGSQSDRINPSSESEDILISAPKLRSRNKKKTSHQSPHKTSLKSSTLNDVDADAQRPREEDEEGGDGEMSVQEDRNDEDEEEETFEVDAREVMDWVRHRLESSTRSLPNEEEEEVLGATGASESSLPSQEDQQLDQEQGCSKTATPEKAAVGDKRKKRKKKFLAGRRKKVQQPPYGEDQEAQDGGGKLPVPKPRVRSLSPIPPPPPTPPPRAKLVVDEVTGEEVVCPVRLYTRSQQVTFVNIKSPSSSSLEQPDPRNEARLQCGENGEEKECGDPWQGNEEQPLKTEDGEKEKNGEEGGGTWKRNEEQQQQRKNEEKKEEDIFSNNEGQFQQVEKEREDGSTCQRNGEMIVERLGQSQRSVEDSGDEAEVVPRNVEDIELERPS